MPFKINTLSEKPSNPTYPYYSFYTVGGNTTITCIYPDTVANGIYFNFIKAGINTPFSIVITDHIGWDSDTVTINLETNDSGDTKTSIEELFIHFLADTYMNTNFEWDYEGNNPLEVVPYQQAYMSPGAGGTMYYLPDNQLYLYNSGNDYDLFIKAFDVWLQLNISTDIQ